MNSRRKVLYAVAMMFGLVCGTGHASVITFNKVISSSSAINGAGAGTFSAPLNLTMTLSQFDPSLGTLTQVSWKDSIDNINMDWAITNTSATETAAFSYSPYTLGGSKSEFPLCGPTGSSSNSAKNTTTTLSPGGTITGSLGVLLSPDNQTITDPSCLSQYVGLGDMTATFGETANIKISDLTGLSKPSELTTTSNTWSSKWTRTISYTYDPASVPEPATLALLGIGFVGLGAIRRKQRN